MEAEIDASEQNDQTDTRFSPDMIEERIKANLEPLHAQVSASTELMDKLIQGNSARELTTDLNPNRFLPNPLELLDSHQ